MGASANKEDDPRFGQRIYDIRGNGLATKEGANETFSAIYKLTAPHSRPVSDDPILRRVLNQADIDISGPEFDFVRSVRVFHVQFAYQRVSGSDENCTRSASVELGTYGMQGGFSWSRSTPDALPPAHIGLEQWGEDCPSISHRSIFVDWRDYGGAYGFEQVDY